MRVYQAGSKGGVQFAGEDRIDHTPKDETLKLRIGTAFDVVCERNQVDFEKIAANTYEVEYEIKLRNHKTAPVRVEVKGLPQGVTVNPLTIQPGQTQGLLVLSAAADAKIACGLVTLVGKAELGKDTVEKEITPSTLISRMGISRKVAPSPEVPISTSLLNVSSKVFTGASARTRQR